MRRAPPPAPPRRRRGGRRRRRRDSRSLPPASACARGSRRRPRRGRRRSRRRSTVKTTSFATVAQPKSARGAGAPRAVSPRRRVEGDKAAAARSTESSVSAPGADGAAPARRGRRPGRRAGRGVRHRRLDAAEQAGADGHAPPRQRAEVVPVQSDEARPEPLCVRRSQAITRPALPAPKTSSTDPRRSARIGVASKS